MIVDSREDISVKLNLGDSVIATGTSEYVQVYNRIKVIGAAGDTISATINGVVMELSAGDEIRMIVKSASVDSTITIAVSGSTTYIVNNTPPGTYTASVSKEPGIILYGYKINKTIFQ